MLADILRSGFALAHRRVGLILLDIIWKAIWVVLTVATLFLFGVWITSELRSIEWADTGFGAVNGLIGTALLRQFWNATRREVIATIFAVSSVSAGLWLFLE